MSAMAKAKAISGHSAPKSGMAMAIAATPVAPPLASIMTNWTVTGGLSTLLSGSGTLVTCLHVALSKQKTATACPTVSDYRRQC